MQMRKLLLCIFLTFMVSLGLFAQDGSEGTANSESDVATELANSQHHMVSRAIAEKATVYLPKGTYVTLLCGCCDDGKGTIIEIDKAYYKPSDQKDLYEVWIEGKMLATYELNFRKVATKIKRDSTKIEPMPIDLAYTFAQPNVFVPGQASKNSLTDFAIAYTMKLPLKDPKQCVYEIPSGYIILR